MHFRKDHVVELLGDSVVLWGVMNSELLSCALLLEMESGLLPSVLTSSVGMKNEHSGSVLSVEGGLILLVCAKGVALVFEEVQISELGFVICETDVVSAPFDCSNWCRPP